MGLNLEFARVNASTDMIFDMFNSESNCETKGEVYREARAEYGKCISKVYVDRWDGGKAKEIGWVFQKKEKYSDTGESYLAETWVTIADLR